MSEMTNEQIADGLKRFMDAAAQYMGDDYPFVLAAEARLRAPAALPEGWISVNDRLPPEGEWYAVMLADPDDVGWATDCWWRAYFNNGGYWDSCEAIEDGQPVTHWFSFAPTPSGVSAPAAGVPAIDPMPNRRVHELKVWPEFYPALESGEKTFELRKDDRGFRAGDVLHLREWNPRSKIYSGREMRRLVTYIISGQWGLETDVVCMALAAAPAANAQPSELPPTERQMFETAMRARWANVALGRLQQNPDMYASSQVQTCWQSWQDRAAHAQSDSAGDASPKLLDYISPAKAHGRLDGNTWRFDDIGLSLYALAIYQATIAASAATKGEQQ